MKRVLLVTLLNICIFSGGIFAGFLLRSIITERSYEPQVLKKIITQQISEADILHTYYPIDEERTIKNPYFEQHRTLGKGDAVLAETVYDHKRMRFFVTGLILSRSQSRLKKPAANVHFVSYALSSSNDFLYALVENEKNGSTDLFVYDLRDCSQGCSFEKLTTNLFEGNAMDMGALIPFFIYPINDQRILISFTFASTGRHDSDVTSYRIFDLSKKNFVSDISFDEGDEGEEVVRIPQTLLNYKDNILSSFIALYSIQNSIEKGSTSQFVKFIRRDVNLITGTMTTIDLPKVLYDSLPLSPVFSCESNFQETCEHLDFQKYFPDVYQLK